MKKVIKLKKEILKISSFTFHRWQQQIKLEER